MNLFHRVQGTLSISSCQLHQMSKNDRRLVIFEFLRHHVMIISSSVARHIVSDVGPLAEVPREAEEGDAERLDRHLHGEDGVGHRPVIVKEAVAYGVVALFLVPENASVVDQRAEEDRAGDRSCQPRVGISYNLYKTTRQIPIRLRKCS